MLVGNVRVELGSQGILEIQDWEKELQVIIRVQRSQIRKLAIGGEGYSSVHFARAALEILDSKFHAVCKVKMQTILGGQGGEVVADAVLCSLVRANAVSVRPFSTFPAKDIPLEVRF